ncbi:MAG: protein-disulfide reductase DsbD family protein [Elusimicrobia bacterium]|nr:protein-disulfide reductase DsbD family protein [Elusimicrobiota bacterium]
MSHFIFAVVLLLSGPARAGHVDASLLSSLDTVRPGESFKAALRLRLRDGWHVYWKNPGDAGLAPSIAWSLPAGWSASEPEWPAPLRLEEPPVTNFGYSSDVVLPLTMTAPSGSSPGTRAALRAKVEWLECRETCVPGSADLVLRVGVGSEGRDRDGDKALIEAAAALVPRRDDEAVDGAGRDGDRVVLRLAGRHPLAQFFPSEPDVFDNARSPVSVSPVGTEISLKPARPDGVPAAVEGVLVRPGLPPVLISVPVKSGAGALRFLLLAFGGGLLLNLMPCVLPVLTFKALGLLNNREKSHSAARLEALFYTAGVVLSCTALGLALIGARAAGGTLGWGTQFQSPWLVGALALLFAFAGLCLLGVFEFGARWMGVGSSLSARQGLTGSFFSGVFAMVAGAPCTAPFMGATIGWAVTRPAPEVLAVCGALGLGTAAPYALFSSWPSLVRALPKPGDWMVTLKKALALPMFGTALWLAWVLWRLLAAAPIPQDPLWKTWTPAAVEQARNAGHTVFVDFTAAWCLSCQVNERTALASPEVKAALAAPGVDAFRADWTSRDGAIQDELTKYGRNGVPLYVVHPRGGPAVLLPELLTPGLVMEALGAVKDAKGERKE